MSSRARICGALSAVIQSSPAGLSSSRMRALVIMPRSPTSTTRASPALFELVDLRRQCRWIGGIPLKHLDRDRTAIGGTQQAVNDLRFALLAVPRTAERSQHLLDQDDETSYSTSAPMLRWWRASAVSIAAWRSPSQSRARWRFDLVDRTEPEPPAQARTGGVGGEIARGGEFGGGCDEPAGDQRDRQRRQTLVGGPAEPPVEGRLPGSCPAPRRRGRAARRGGYGPPPRSRRPPCAQRVRPSTSAVGQVERLARVRFLPAVLAESFRATARPGVSRDWVSLQYTWCLD